MKILVIEDEKLLASINALLRRQAGQVNEMVFGNTALDLGTSMLMARSPMCLFPLNPVLADLARPLKNDVIKL